MSTVRLTTRGKIVLALAASLVAAWLLAYWQDGYDTCIERGYPAVVCAE